MINLTFQVKRLRCTEVKLLVQGHTMSESVTESIFELKSD